MKNVAELNVFNPKSRLPACTNEPTQDEVLGVKRFCRSLRGAHTIDIKVRKDGKDYWFEGDWLKYVPQYLDAAGHYWPADTNPTWRQRVWRRVWWWLRLMPVRRNRK